MARVMVVGAGISGLTTAFVLHKRGHQVLVLERDAVAGGALRSVREEGFLVELGPNSTLDRSGGVASLAGDLGLDGECLEANQSASRRYVAKEGRPLALPGGLLAFLASPLFSPTGKLRLLWEPFVRRAADEESIAAFVRRRLGPEFLDWAVDPFVSGVYAGDPERLSVRAATSRIYALEAEYGSLFIGALRRMLKGRATGPAPRGRLLSFRDGMQALPAAMAARLGEVVHTGIEVTEVMPATGGWRVMADGISHAAEQVVLSVPSHVCAELLRPLNAPLAQALEGIRYAPVASVALGLRREHVEHPLDGFGMLIPRRLGLETLGVLFSSTLFPGRAPEGSVLLTAFLGGARNPDAVGRPDNVIVDQVMEDLRPLLGIRGTPSFQRVTLWPRAIPQYEIGHLDRLQRISGALAGLPGLHLQASWSGGISVADCVASATALAERLGTEWQTARAGNAARGASGDGVR